MNVTDVPDESGYNWVLPPKVTLLEVARRVRRSSISQY